MDNAIKKAVEQATEVLKDPNNKNAIAASAVAYYLSTDNKERNAIIAGILAYAFLGEEEE